jgi:hypothetical protein
MMLTDAALIDLIRKMIADFGDVRIMKQSAAFAETAANLEHRAAVERDAEMREKLVKHAARARHMEQIAKDIEDGKL